MGVHGLRAVVRTSGERAGGREDDRELRGDRDLSMHAI